MNKNYKVHFIGGGISMEGDINTVAEYLSKRNNDDVLYIEDMDMKPLLDKVIQALRTGVLAGFTFMDGSYYYKGSLWYRGTMPITEMDMRRRLQEYYKKDPSMIEEDESYIEERIRELA